MLIGWTQHMELLKKYRKWQGQIYIYAPTSYREFVGYARHHPVRLRRRVQTRYDCSSVGLLKKYRTANSPPVEGWQAQPDGVVFCRTTT